MPRLNGSETQGTPASRTTAAVSVGRPVVDDHDVELGDDLTELVEDRGQRLLLVEGGDDDDGACVRPRTHPSDSLISSWYSSSTLTSQTSWAVPSTMFSTVSIAVYIEWSWLL